MKPYLRVLSCLSLLWLCGFIRPACSGDLNASQRLGRALYLGYQPWTHGENSTRPPLPLQFTACAGCHGTSGQGQNEGGQRVPALIWRNLTQNNSSGAGYMQASAILKAIENGKGRQGKTLNPVMPRFTLAPRERKALMDYLKILGTPADHPPGVDATTVRVGSVLPLKGPMAAIGTAIKRGLQASFEQINTQGGIHGRQIELIIQAAALNVDSTRKATQALVTKQTIYALVGGFSGNDDFNPSADSSALLLAQQHISHIAGLNMPRETVTLQQAWSAPLLPSFDEQLHLLTQTSRQVCPEPKEDWILTDPTTSMVTQSPQTSADPEQLLGAMRARQSSHGATQAYRVISLAAADTTASLGRLLQELSNDPVLIDDHSPSCIAYLPFMIGGLIDWPNPWQEVLVTPLPDELMLQAHENPLRLWEKLGRMAGQIFVEALAEAGPQLSERSVIEALPKLNGLRLQNGLQLTYRKNRLHAFEPLASVTQLMPKRKAPASLSKPASQTLRNL